MSFNLTEISEQSNSPIELYEFRRNLKTWYFTSAEADIEYEYNSYISVPLKRSEIETTSEQARNAITITCPRNFEIAELFRVSPKHDKISLTLRRFHRDDDTSEAAVIWKGAVLNADWKGGQAELQCEPISVSVKRSGLQRLSQRNCTWVLYGRGCNLNKDDFKTDTTIVSIDGVTIEVASLDVAFNYGGGWVEKEDVDGNFERRFIEFQTGTTITLGTPFFDLAINDNVSVYPGCDHTMTTCNDVFENILNYGGTCPFLPLKNPFGSDPIF